MREYPDLRLPSPVAVLPKNTEWPLEIRQYLSRLVIEHVRATHGDWEGVAKWILCGMTVETEGGKRTIPYRATTKHLYPYLTALARGEVLSEKEPGP